MYKFLTISGLLMVILCILVVVYLQKQDTNISHYIYNSTGKLAVPSGMKITVKNDPNDKMTPSQYLFRAPNIEWKSRSITLANGKTLHYEFGKGNPLGSLPLSEKEISIYNHECDLDGDLSVVSCGRAGEEVFGYVTPEVEKDLLSLISHPAWEKILTHCEANFRMQEKGVVFLDGEPNYDSIFSRGYLDMENMLSIDSKTGRKSLGNFLNLKHWLANTMIPSEVLLNASNQDASRNESLVSINNCITQNGGIELYRLFDLVHQKSFRPLGNYSERLTDPAKYVPWW